jgi:G:T/U-mismatch repair DNA glycosylase
MAFAHPLTAKTSAEIPKRNVDDPAPYVCQFNWKSASFVGRWRERLAGVCSSCFEAAKPCTHFAELPLRLLILGNNPSEVAFETGWNYANPTNRFMQLLKGNLGDKHLHFGGLFPSDAGFEYQNICALDRGIGITDMSPEPGNDVSAFFEKNGALPERWKDDTYRAFQGHMRRVGETLEYLLERASTTDHEGKLSSTAKGKEKAGAGSSSQAKVGQKRAREEHEDDDEEVFVAGKGPSTSAPISPEEARAALDVIAQLAAWELPDAAAGVAPGVAAAPAITPITTKAQCHDPRYTAPRIVACTGKTQWTSLFKPPLKRCDHGLQPSSLRPPGWPFPPSTHVFVLASSSGRAALSNEARSAPYRELAAIVDSMPWLKPQVSTPLSATELTGPALQASSSSSSSSSSASVVVGASSSSAPAAAGSLATFMRASPPGGSAKKARKEAEHDEAPEATTSAGRSDDGSGLARALVKAAPSYRKVFS